MRIGEYSAIDTSKYLENFESVGFQKWHELNLNRTGNRVSKDFLENKGVKFPHVGFEWKEEDNEVKFWRPQGISGSIYTNYGIEKKYLTVSWYGRSDGNEDYTHKGVRVSFIDVTSMDAIKYRHVLLVQPDDSGNVFKPIVMHAGGIAWYDDLLYVVDSQVEGYNSIRVFDTTKFVPAQRDDSKNQCGIINGKILAFNYRAILPQVKKFDVPYYPLSFISISHQNNKPYLITGSFSKCSENKTLRWWDFLSDSEKLILEKEEEFEMEKTQGALGLDNERWFSRSWGRNNDGSLKIMNLDSGREVIQKWPKGVEDLHYVPKPTTGDNLWCLSEFSNNRIVFAIKLEKYRTLL